MFIYPQFYPNNANKIALVLSGSSACYFGSSSGLEETSQATLPRYKLCGEWLVPLEWL